MKTIWFKDCKTEEDKQLVRDSVKNSVALKQLYSILEDELKVLDRREMTPDYTNASWSHLQAHRNGDRQRLVQTMNLLDITKDDPPNE
jgi:hypothetical protein